MLFNEPKLLKFCFRFKSNFNVVHGFSALQRAEIAEIRHTEGLERAVDEVSVLFNEPKLLKSWPRSTISHRCAAVSVLFNEPKLLKSRVVWRGAPLRRVVSVLFNEPKLLKSGDNRNAPRDLIAFQCSSTSRNC